MELDSKRCPLCGLVKPRSDFHKQSASRDGLQNRCKSCAIANSIKWNGTNPERRESWRRANKDRLKAYRRKWRDANKDHARELGRKWRATNKQRIRETRRKWLDANKERLKEERRKRYEANAEAERLRNRDRRFRYRRLHEGQQPTHEKVCYVCRKLKGAGEFYRHDNKTGLNSRCKKCCSDLARQWREKNPLRVKAAIRRRIGRLATAPGGEFKATRTEYLQRLAYYGCICAYCAKAPATELDHAIPVSRGGGNWPANIYPACLKCNRSKHDKKLHSEWVPPIRRLDVQPPRT